MAWRERNLFQKFDLLFPYRNLVTSILFFSLSLRYDFNSHFPSHRNFLYKLHPSRSTQPPIFNFLFITTDPENRFSTPWLANSHGRKEKKNVYATHRTPFPSSRFFPLLRFDFEEKRYRTLLEFPLLSSAEQIFTGTWHDGWQFVTPFFLFIFLFFSAAKFNPKPADWCVELYLSRGAAAV